MLGIYWATKLKRFKNAQKKEKKRIPIFTNFISTFSLSLYPYILSKLMYDHIIMYLYICICF